MIIECTFRNSTAKFDVLVKGIETNINNAIRMVEAVYCLHNITIDLKSNTLNDNGIRSNYLELNELSNSRRTNRLTKAAFGMKEKCS